MATSTLDPDASGPNLTLSNGNLTAKNTGASNVDNRARATPQFRSGKWYWEATLDASSNTGVRYVGIMKHQQYPRTWLGSDTDSVGWAPTGAVTYNTGTLSTIQTYAQGNTVCIALDMDAQLIWFRTGAGNWNNSGTANPATGAGGISIASILSIPGTVIHPAVAGYDLNSQVTINLGGSAFAQTAPSGFSAANTWAMPTVNAFNSVVAYRSATYSQYGAVNGTGSSSHAQITGAQANRTNAFSGAWFGGYKTYSPSTHTVVSGQVQENGVAVANKRVFLFDRTSGLLLGTTLSNGSGNFSIEALGRTNTMVVGVDSPYNALIFDAVAPV